MSITEWAYEHVVYSPGAELTKPEARVSWVMWCSEHGIRPGPGTGMSKAIVAHGGKARQKPTRWENVTLLDPIDSGYRVRSRDLPPPAPAVPDPQVEAGLRPARCRRGH